MTMTRPAESGQATRRTAAATARSTLGRAARHLLDLQDEQGWWQGELETNVSIDAEDLLLREFLGHQDRRADRRDRPLDQVPAARRRHLVELLRGQARPVHHGRGLRRAAAGRRLAGRLPHGPGRGLDPRPRAASRPTRVFTRIWLALFGEWSWDDLPVMPPELIYLPSWFPLNVYDWGCWARQTIVAADHRGLAAPGPPAAVRPEPSCTARPAPKTPDRLTRPRRPSRSPADAAWARVFAELDRALHVYDRHGLRARPLRAVRPAAIRRCADWILARQEKDGCWGGIQPPWVYSLIALHLLGYEVSHPVMASAAWPAWTGFTVWEADPGRPGPADGMPASRRSGTPCWP